MDLGMALAMGGHEADALPALHAGSGAAPP
jgi:hypothetical protein